MDIKLAEESFTDFGVRTTAEQDALGDNYCGPSTPVAKFAMMCCRKRISVEPDWIVKLVWSSRAIFPP